MSAATCGQCGRLPTIGGNYETVLVAGDGFRHAVCDDRWDVAPCRRCGDTDRFDDHGDSVCSTCGATRRKVASHDR